MAKSEQDPPDSGIGLSEAIQALREEFIEAQAKAAGEEVQFPVESLTVQLSVTATRKADGSAGFKVPVINLGAEAKAGWERATLQSVTVIFGAPVDRGGLVVKLGRGSVPTEANLTPGQE